METAKITVGICLFVLITFCGSTWSNQLRMKEYQPSVVKPMFDLMRQYGEQMKTKRKKDMCTKDQFFVALMATHEEILNPSVNISSPTLDEELERHFRGKLTWLANKKVAKCKPAQHAEVLFIREKRVEPMLTEFRQEHPTERTVLLMYSHFIPCADIQNVEDSCSEELDIYATRNWKEFGLLVAYSTYFAGFPGRNGTNQKKSIEFLQLAGIPLFKYQDTPSGENFINVNSVKYASKKDRWRSVTFLHVFFSCLNKDIKQGCLPDRHDARRAIIAFFVNSIAFGCFKNMNFPWKRARTDLIKNCFNNYLENNIGYRYSQCQGEFKKAVCLRCVNSSVEKSLVPGGPDQFFDPFDDTWVVTADVNLTQIFPVSPQKRREKENRKDSCKSKTSLRLESLCTS